MKNTIIKASLLVSLCALSILVLAQGKWQKDIDLGFPKNRINAAIKGAKSKHYEVTFQFNNQLRAEAYQIIVENDQVTVLGGDGNGLLYGGLEVAEQIELYGKVTPAEGKPFLKNRGIKFNIPLDARTPSYDDSGDAAQVNIIEMWNWDFWTTFLDKLALHRYNVLSLWNPHPFPSMIELPNYPDVALDDVQVTTLKPVGRENEWGEPQLVSANVLDHLKTVKKITIKDKITFWRKVMQYANSRGIDIYFITWNICPNSVAEPVPPYHKTYGVKEWNEKPGKHGVSHQMNNPKTISYYREAVKTFLLTYPEIKGIGVTAGEYMPPTWDGYNREQWLWETYGRGILDVKTVQPDRQVPFIHRVWYSDMDQIMKYWKNYPDSFEVSFKYSKARVYSSPTPPFAQKHIEQMKPYGLKSWWNLRNDDIFVYRWGDSDYVRTFLNFFQQEYTAGYYFGSDGYVWGREFISKDPGLKGMLEIDKHWYSFMLWGRLGYDNELENAFFKKKLALHYKGLDAEKLFSIWQTASEIIPNVNTFHWRDWDHMWSVEACLSRPVLGGFRGIEDFVDNPTMEGSGLLNPEDYAWSVLHEEKSSKISPITFADQLRAKSKTAIEGAVAMRKSESIPAENAALLNDIEAMGDLGTYYAEKINAAIALAFYQQTNEGKYKEQAVHHAEQALEYWIAYAKISSTQYRPQMLARTNLIDWNAMINEAKEEVRRMKRLK